MSAKKNSKGLYYIPLLVILFILFFIVSLIKAQDKKTNELKDDAIIVSQSIPGRMFAGHTYNLFVRLRNTGSTIWTPNYYKLALVKQGDDKLWDFKPLNVRSRVERGSDVTFSFRIKTPSAPGHYRFELRMEANGKYFGETAGPTSVNVRGEPTDETNPQMEIKTKNDDSEFLMQIMTNEMTAGNNYEVSITMQNTGKTTWTKKDGYALGFLDSLLNIEKNNLKYTRIVLSEDVPPGKEATFHFTVKAPPAPGTYEFRWEMEHDNIYFGEPSDIYSVKVE
jgi:hypothetical protein